MACQIHAKYHYLCSWRRIYLYLPSSTGYLQITQKIDGAQVQLITSWSTVEISATFFALITSSHRTPLRITSYVTTSLLLTTQSPTPPTDRHQRRQTFEAACQLRGELLLVGPSLPSFVQPCTHIPPLATPVQNAGRTPSKRLVPAASRAVRAVCLTSAVPRPSCVSHAVTPVSSAKT